MGMVPPCAPYVFSWRVAADMFSWRVAAAARNARAAVSRYDCHRGAIPAPRPCVCAHGESHYRPLVSTCFYVQSLFLRPADVCRNQKRINIVLHPAGFHTACLRDHLSSKRAAAARGPAAHAPRQRVGSLAGRALLPVVSKYATENAEAVQSLPRVSVYPYTSIFRSA